MLRALGCCRRRCVPAGGRQRLGAHHRQHGRVQEAGPQEADGGSEGRERGVAAAAAVLQQGLSQQRIASLTFAPAVTCKTLTATPSAASVAAISLQLSSSRTCVYSFTNDEHQGVSRHTAAQHPLLWLQADMFLGQANLRMIMFQAKVQGRHACSAAGAPSGQ